MQSRTINTAIMATTFGRLAEFRRSETLCDVALVAFVGGGEPPAKIHAHRVVLAAASEFFRAIFTREMAEQYQNEIPIGGTDARTLETLVEFAYGAALPIDETNVAALLAGADFLACRGALDECGRFMRAHLSVGNAVGFWRLASAYSASSPRIAKLHKTIELFIRDNLCDVMTNLHNNGFTQFSTEMHVLSNESSEALQILIATQVRASYSHHHPEPPTDALVTAGIIPLLMAWLESTNGALQLQAAAALASVVGIDEETRAVVDAGAVPRLIQLLVDSPSNVDVCEHALAALAEIIGEGAHFRDVCIEAGCVEPLLRFVMTPTTPLPLLRNIAWAMRYLCGTRPSLSLEVARMLLGDALATLLRNEDTDVLSNAVFALSRLIDAGGEHAQLVVDSGLVECLVPLLEHSDIWVHNAAVRTAVNLIADNPQPTAPSISLLSTHIAKGWLHEESVEFLVNTAGVYGMYFRVDELAIVEPLLKHVDAATAADGGATPPPPPLRVVAWAIEAFAKERFGASLPHELLQQLLRALTMLFERGEDDTCILYHNVWALRYLLHETDTANLQAIFDSGIVPRLVALLAHSDAHIQSGAVLAIAYNADERHQRLLDAGALQHMPAMLSHAEDEREGDALILIRCFASFGTEAQRQALIDAGLVPALIQRFEHNQFRTRLLAVSAIAAMLGRGSVEQLRYLVESCGVVGALCGLLNENVSITCKVLRGLKDLLQRSAAPHIAAVCASIEECGGLDELAYLSTNTQVTMMASEKEIREMTGAIREITDAYFANAMAAAKRSLLGIIEE